MPAEAEYHMYGQGKRNNKKFTIGANDSVTCHFKDSDDDTATDKYYGIRHEAKKVSIITNLAAAITHIDGVELDFPMTIPTGGRTFREGINWSDITVKSDQAATTLEIYAS